MCKWSLTRTTYGQRDVPPQSRDEDDDDVRGQEDNVEVGHVQQDRGTMGKKSQVVRVATSPFKFDFFVMWTHTL